MSPKERVGVKLMEAGKLEEVLDEKFCFQPLSVLETCANKYSEIIQEILRQTYSEEEGNTKKDQVQNVDNSFLLGFFDQEISVETLSLLNFIEIKPISYSFFEENS